MRFRYPLLALLLYAAAWGLGGVRAAATGRAVEFKSADAWGYYAYLPAVLIDGNLQFQNQPIYGTDPAAEGQKLNRWPIGLALTIAPAFLLAHALAVPVHAATGWAAFAPDGYSYVYTVLTLAQLIAFAVLCLSLGERLLRGRFGVRPRAAWAAVLVGVFGTNYLWYILREPYLSHVANGSWVMLAAYAFHRADAATRDPAARVWPWLGLFGFAAAMSVACRITGAVVLLPMVVLLAATVVRRGRATELLKVLPLAPAAALPIALQLWAMPQVLALVGIGGFIHNLGYDDEEMFYWTRPALLRTLASSRGGLLFFAPVLLVAAVGLAGRLRRGGWRDPLLAGLGLGWLVLWYLNGAWYAWWFGSAFGQRAMLSLSVLGLIGLGLAFESAAAADPRRGWGRGGGYGGGGGGAGWWSSACCGAGCCSGCGCSSSCRTTASSCRWSGGRTSRRGSGFRPNRALQSRMQLNGLYVLDADAYPRIYGPAERQRIARHVRLAAEPMGADALRRRPELLRGVDVLLSGWGGPTLDAELLAHADRLKAFFYGAGSVKGLLTDAAWDRGLLVTSAFAANAVPVAEFALAQVVMCLKDVWRTARLTRETRQLPRPTPAGCYGSTVGLLSLGAIGRLVAELLRDTLAVRVLAHDPFADAAAAASLNVELVELPRLFAEGDVVSVHAPWLPETEGLVTGALLRSMRPNASFLNTARGAVVDEPAMVAALRDRPDLLAVLDVTHPEPPAADSPLWTLPNVVLTPHVAGSQGAECRRMGAFVADEVERFAAARPPRWPVTRQMAARMA